MRLTLVPVLVHIVEVALIVVEVPAGVAPVVGVAAVVVENEVINKRIILKSLRRKIQCL